eukprot:6959271-Prymnesium_polylepis.1
MNWLSAKSRLAPRRLSSAPPATARLRATCATSSTMVTLPRTKALPPTRAQPPSSRVFDSRTYSAAPCGQIGREQLRTATRKAAVGKRWELCRWIRLLQHARPVDSPQTGCHPSSQRL